MPEKPGINRDEIRNRRISTEEMLRAQLDRINEIRTDTTRRDRTAAWSEAVEALYDTLIPWTRGNADFKAKWEQRTVSVIKTEEDMFLAVPTAKDCRQAQLLLMELMDEKGLLVKRHNTSGPAPRTGPQPTEGTDLAGIEVPA